MPVVVVESPAKAKTINKYLGSDYTVLASYGHVRDLPAKDGSVDTEHDFAMTWEVAADSKKHIRAITEALKTDDELILATDPDREGEAISWHLQEALASTLKKGKKVSRVTFNAITKDAVTEAMKNPRQVDTPLVEAYLARRALDYLVGFTLSPVLWRKLPGSRSAGRVQSVCLRLIVEREMEIEAFRAREFWTVTAMLLGGFMIHGIQPGPLLFVSQGPLVYTIFIAMLVSSLMMMFAELFGVRVFVKLLGVPKYILLPIILVLCFVGAFGLGNRIFDVGVIVFFGLLGYGFVKFKIPQTPFIIGLILGPMAETNLRRGLMLSDNNFLEFLTHPISGSFIALSVASVVWHVVKAHRSKARVAVVAA